jgi:hypothetical protein
MFLVDSDLVQLENGIRVRLYGRGNIVLSLCSGPEWWRPRSMPPVALASSPEPSTRGIVGIAQDVRLKLQILQSMLDYIADADDSDQLAVA